METKTYCVDKASEGGIGQRQALLMLKDANLKCRPGYSPYVGLTGVEVDGNKKDQLKARRILFGR